MWPNTRSTGRGEGSGHTTARVAAREGAIPPHGSWRGWGIITWSTSATADAAAESDGKVQTAAAAAGGTACSRSVSSVMTPSVPSLCHTQGGMDGGTGPG